MTDLGPRRILHNIPHANIHRSLEDLKAKRVYTLDEVMAELKEE